ncbi:HalX domain-containing protein [Haloplanus aerogenes]|uniref:Response regulator n=1 Tax=Haloplanus aerogenes TaxID=660522 RepID=A0A3M0DSC9_9EURY|nr:HalX domain-containing protein [Haloplanus aerogenes]AZH25323.1 response regulator [Haloplanus aerogenes]RMB25019.1 response regulator receiver domain-containing protein [Haloplanus aerogenes]
MTPTLSDATVLIVDDEQSLADLYAYWIDEFAEAHTAYDGTEALEKLDDYVDVMLLDRRMPGLSGDEVVDEVEKQGLDVRIVMVTAVDPGFDIVDMGIDDYLIKPVDQPELVDTVERMMVRSTYDDQLQEKFQLVEKKVTLEAAKTPHELEESEEYTELNRRLEAIERDLDSAVEEFDENDFTVAFRELPDGGPVDSTEG